MKYTQQIAATLCAVVITLSGSVPVSAQSLPAVGQSETGWRYTLGLYAFLPLSTTGSSTISGRSVPVDLDLGDILSLLDFAAAGRFEAWSGDWGLIFDSNYTSIGADGPLPAPAGATFSVNVRQKWLAAMAAYRLADGTYGPNGQRYTFDVQGGVRYNSLRQSVNITTPGPVVIPTLGGDESWWEPVIGARGMWRLNDRWSTVASIDLGGFGAGGNDLQVGANIGFDFKPWERTSIIFGYRYYSMDFSKSLAGGTFAYDTVQHGPYVGVKFLFD